MTVEPLCCIFETNVSLNNNDTLIKKNFKFVPENLVSQDIKGFGTGYSFGKDYSSRKIIVITTDN